MRSRAIGALAVLAFVAVLAHTEQARAGGVIIYHSGEDVFPAGPLPAPLDEIQLLKGAEAGYKCSIFGLFWAYFHIWGCQPVAVKGNTVYTDPEIGKAVAAKYTESDMKVGLWTKHGRWVFAAIGIVLIIGAIRGRGDDDDDEDDDVESEDDDDDESSEAKA